MQQEFETRLAQNNQPTTLLEHGFVKALFKKCRILSKKLEDCTMIENKQKTGAKCTEQQLAKLAQKAQFQAEINADLSTLDLFLQFYEKPQVAAPVVPDQPEEKPEPVEVAPQIIREIEYVKQIETVEKEVIVEKEVVVEKVIVQDNTEQVVSALASLISLQFRLQMPQQWTNVR